MNRLLMGAGAVALAGTLVSLFAPKAVHATVAALVLVTNTPANPVPNADVNAPGEPFQTVLCNSIGSDSCGGGPNSFVVPAKTLGGLSVKRLAIEYVSMNCSNGGVSCIAGSLDHVHQCKPSERQRCSCHHPSSAYPSCLRC
jgi:hypothetical protein